MGHYDSCYEYDENERRKAEAAKKKKKSAGAKPKITKPKDARQVREADALSAAKIAALEAQLEDADNRIEELQALLREWSSGERVKALESRLAEERRVREASMGVFASLVAATHLLRNGGRKAAPSDKMFQQMLDDYEEVADRYRATLAAAAKLGGG